MMRRSSSLALPLILLACADGGPFSGAERLDDYVERGASLLWVAAHPDDETMAGPLLTYACLHVGVRCHVVVLTRGEGGRCGLPDGCKPDLGTVRAAEMRAAAGRLTAGLDIGRFNNHPSDVAFDAASRAKIRSAWEAQGDPVAWLTEVLKRVEPDLVLTLDPSHGYTGHVEHALVSEIVGEVVRAGTRSSPAVFHVLNRHELTKQIFGLDPTTPTQEWNATRDCGGRSCTKLAVVVGREHKSQLGPSLGLLLLLMEKQATIYLRRIDR
jgi:LmbE family N-acetylglucosaminyl deacetylase